MAGSRLVPELDGLLAAARDVLAERGYDGLRVEDVLREAGLSTRAFYRHFSGKADCALAAVRCRLVNSIALASRVRNGSCPSRMG